MMSNVWPGIADTDVFEFLWPGRSRPCGRKHAAACGLGVRATGERARRTVARSWLVGSVVAVSALMAGERRRGFVQPQERGRGRSPWVTGSARYGARGSMAADRKPRIEQKLG